MMDDFFNGISKPIAAAMDAVVLAAAQTYADGVSQGMDAKASCRLATIAALASYTRTANVLNANANGAMPTIDGVAPQVGDSILLKDGAAGADNWIYTVNSLGSNGTKWQMTRRSDSDTSAKVTSGACVEIAEGSQAGTAWYISTADPITLNTTSLTISQWSGRVDTDGTLAGNSDFRVPSQKAVKTYASPKTSSSWLMVSFADGTTSGVATGTYYIDPGLTAAGPPQSFAPKSILVPAGHLRQVMFKVGVNTVTSGSYVFTVCKTNSAGTTAYTWTVNNNSTALVNQTGDVSFADGDVVLVTMVTSGTLTGSMIGVIIQLMFSAS